LTLLRRAAKQQKEAEKELKAITDKYGAGFEQMREQ